MANNPGRFMTTERRITELRFRVSLNRVLSFIPKRLKNPRDIITATQSFIFPSSYLSISKLSEPNSQCTRIIQSSITGDKWVDLESIDHGHPLRDAFESSMAKIYILTGAPRGGKSKESGRHRWENDRGNPAG